MKKISLLLIAVCFSISTFSQSFTSAGTGFIQNKGQIIDQNNNPNPGCLFLLNLREFNVQLRKGGFSYEIVKAEERQENATPVVKGTDTLETTNYAYHVHRVDIDLKNANTNAEIITENALRARTNYYTTGTQQQGALNVQTFLKVTYKNIYPHIDIEFLADKKTGFKYNFILHPGADINHIQLQYIGAKNVRLQNEEIEITTSQNTFTEKIPFSFLAENNNEIKVNYVTITPNTFGFSTATTITKNQTLVIDPNPTLLWATFFDGPVSTGDQAQAVAHDSMNNVVVTGVTTSTSNIATAGAYQVSYAGNNDAFIAKFNNLGVLLWATYYGGAQADYGYAIKVGNDYSMIMAGITTSPTGISTPGAHQTTLAGTNYDAMVVKFDSSGVRQWGTYYGGTTNDYFYTLEIFPNGDIFLGGTTSSPTGISTPGSFQSTFNGPSSNIMLVKLNVNGIRVWGTYFGESGTGIFNTCTTPNGHLMLVGYSYAAAGTGITTPGAYQTSGAGDSDGLIAEFDTSGSRLWATYYGGTGSEMLIDVVVDDSLNIVVSGRSTSTTGVTTPGAYQTVYQGGLLGDGLVVKFDSLGFPKWATYYGGTGYDGDLDIVTNKACDYFICSSTESTGGIATTGSYQTSFGGGRDAYIAAFTSNGNLAWGTYYGDAGFDQAMAADMNENEQLIVVGAGSGNLTTAGAHQTTVAGGTSAALIAVFEVCASAPVKPAVITGDTMVCAATVNTYSIANVSGATSYTWNLPAGWSGSSDSTSITATAGATSGTITVTANNSCGNSVARTLQVWVNAAPAQPASITGNSTVCNGSAQNYSVTNDSTATAYTWNLPMGWTGTSNSNTIAATAGATGIISVTTSNVCGTSAAQTINVNVTTAPVQPSSISGNISVCDGSIETYSVTNDTLATGYTWNLPLGWTGTSADSSITVTAGSTGIVSLTAENSCGSSTAQTLNVTVNALPTVSLALNATSVCVDNAVFVITGGNPSGGTYSGTGVTGSSFNAATAGVATHTITYSFTDGNGCTNFNSDQITVNNCTGIFNAESQISNFELSPNPFTNEISITGDFNGAVKLTMINALGQPMYSTTLTSNLNLQTSHLPSGMYFIQFTQGEKMVTKKIIKR